MLKTYGLSLIILSLTAHAIVASGCGTRIVCPAEKLCICSLGASSAFHRHFYINFTDTKAGKYYCSLKTIINNEKVETITLSTGIEVEYSSQYPYFPVVVIIDTTKSVDKINTIQIKFFVPASDFPDELNATCQKHI